MHVADPLCDLWIGRVRFAISAVLPEFTPTTTFPTTTDVNLLMKSFRYCVCYSVGKSRVFRVMNISRLYLSTGWNDNNKKKFGPSTAVILFCFHLLQPSGLVIIGFFMVFFCLVAFVMLCFVLIESFLSSLLSQGFGFLKYIFLTLNMLFISPIRLNCK